MKRFKSLTKRLKFSLSAFLDLLNYINFEPVEGLEPPTSALQVRHSAIKVTPAFYRALHGLDQVRHILLWCAILVKLAPYYL